MRRGRASVKVARTLRWLTIGAALTCLPLFVFACLWSTSLDREYECTDVGFHASGADLSLALRFGCVEIEDYPIGRAFAGQFPIPPTATTVYEWRWRLEDNSRWMVDLLPSVSGTGGVSVAVPLWIPAIVLGAWAGLLWRRELWPRAEWRCAKCGYDRRGLVADAKCPECGTVPALPSK
jgi:hypothetical protein